MNNVTAYPCAVNKETRRDGETGRHTGFKLLRPEVVVRVRFPFSLLIKIIIVLLFTANYVNSYNDSRQAS